MKIQYVVKDVWRYLVQPIWNSSSIDLVFYRNLIDKAWAEVFFAFP